MPSPTPPAHRSRFGRYLAPLLLLLALPQAGSAAPPSLEPVTIQLRWHTQFQFAGYYAALAKGYYRDAGYDVTLLEGSPGHSPVTEVLADRAHYGTANSELLYWKLQGKPLVALAAIGQHSPSVLLTRKESGIRSPQDMIGKRVMMIRSGGATDDVDFTAMLRNEGVDPEQVEIIDSSYDVDDLVNGRTDVFNGYLTNEPYYLTRQGIPISVIKPITYGIDFYSDILFTTEQELHDHPERVSAIRDATLRGWRYAMDHSEEMIDLLRERFGADKSRDHLAFEAQALRDLILPDLIEIGHMNPGRWRHMGDTFVQQGLVSPGYSLDGFLYTTDQATDLKWVWWLLGMFAMAAGLAALVAVALLLFNNRLQREVAVRRDAEEQLRRSERNLRTIIQNMQDIFYRTDEAGRLTMISPSCQSIIGFTPEELIGRRLAEFYIEPDGREQFLHTLEASEGSLTGYEAQFVHRDGGIRWLSINAQHYTDAEGRTVGVEGNARDITGRKENEAFIERQAYYDSLTDLGNRRLLRNRLERELVRSQRHHHTGALLFLDLDNFKTINDSLGHFVGDQLLCQVAERLRELVRAEDTVARPGGDEFVLLLVELNDEPEAAGGLAGHTAERIRSRLSEAYRVDGYQLFTTPSIGITLFPNDYDGPDELLKQADIAMYRAKANGKNRIEFYRPVMQQAAKERLSLENSLRQGLADGAFELHYQPQVDVQGRFVGAEALLRWHHPEEGLVAPGRFIPVAEESGLILAIGEWVIDAACRQLRQWRERGILPEAFQLAVNVSPRQFRRPQFVDEVTHALQRHRVPAHALCIELTEGTLLEDKDDAIEKMHALKSLGAHIAIDDFGTGYSSLSYLKRLPLDTLKVDRSFVCDITTNANDATIVETILFMTRQLGMEAVAEGVEDAATLEALQQLGFVIFQGFHFDRPMPAAAFEARLSALPALQELTV